MSASIGDDAPVSALPGLGPKSSARLAEAGVTTAGELRAVGAAVAFLRVERVHARPSRCLLWALQGAIAGKAWTAVTDAEKQRLEAELSRLRG